MLMCIILSTERQTNVKYQPKIEQLLMDDERGRLSDSDNFSKYRSRRPQIFSRINITEKMEPGVWRYNLVLTCQAVLK